MATTQATPPPTITHTTSSPFCTAMRENVGHAIQGLMLNDKLVDKGVSALATMGRQYLTNSALATDSLSQAAVSARMSFGDQRLREIAGSMAHNLSVIDTLLADPKFADTKLGADSQKLAQIKARLLKAKDAQNIAINVLSGVAETQELETFYSAGNDSMNAGLGTGLSADMSERPLDGGPLAKADSVHEHNSGAVSADALRNDPALKDADQYVLDSPLGEFYKDLLVDQRITKEVEASAAAVIIPSAQSCR